MPAVLWRPWSRESFEEAQRRDIPILLSVVLPWSDACRVMDETTFADNRVVSVAEDAFVPVQVDAAARPDIASRYAAAGVPAVAFLTPEGHLITSGGYMDPDSMVDGLAKVASYFESNRDLITEQVAQREATLTQSAEPQGLVTSGVVRKLEAAAKAACDTANGGFGTAPRSLHADLFRFLHLRYARTGDAALLDMFLTALAGICSAPVYDHLEGGFFHGALGADWSGLQYEKLCAENAEMIGVCLGAAKVSKNTEFERLGRQTLEWTRAYLEDTEDGGFWVAQLPDEKYYTSGAEDRSRLGSPAVVKVIYVEPAASMARAYFDAAIGLGMTDAGKAAVVTLERLWEEGFDAEHGMAHLVGVDPEPSAFGFLGDQAAMIELLIRAFELTGAGKHLHRAIALAGIVEGQFGDPEGGFYDRTAEAPGAEPLFGHLRFPRKSPAQNGYAAQAFLKLGTLTHNDHFRQVAAAALRRFTEEIEVHGIDAAAVGIAADFHIRGMAEVMVVGPRNSRDTALLRLGALETFAPAALVNLLDPETDAQTVKVRGLEYPGSPVAYVYYGGERTGPYSAREELGRAVIDTCRSAV